MSFASEPYLKSTKRREENESEAEQFLPFAGALNFYCFMLSSSSSVNDFISRCFCRSFFSLHAHSLPFRSLTRAPTQMYFLCRLAWLLRVIICSSSPAYTGAIVWWVFVWITHLQTRFGSPSPSSPGHHAAVDIFVYR